MKTVCVDLDGVLAEYYGWKGVGHIGPPNPGAADFTAKLKSLGFRVVVFTTRAKADFPDRPEGSTPDTCAARVETWLAANGIPFDEVYRGQGKPIAVAYVDDRSVAIPSNPGPGAFDRAAQDVLSLSRM